MKKLLLFLSSLVLLAFSAGAQLGVQVDTNSALRFPAAQKFWDRNFRDLDLVLFGTTTVSNEMRFVLLTPSRALVLDTNGAVVADVAATGTGAPVRNTAPTITDLTLSGVTVSRALLVDSGGVVVADVSPTGTGSPVRSIGATLSNLTLTGTVTASGLTADRVLRLDTNGVLTVESASTGTGAPVRGTGPTIANPLLTVSTSAPPYILGVAGLSGSAVTAISTNDLRTLLGAGGGGLSGVAANGTGLNSNIVDTGTAKVAATGGALSINVTNLAGEAIQHGTVSSARLASDVALDAEVASVYATITNPVFRGTTTVEGLTITGTLSATNLSVPTQTSGTSNSTAASTAFVQGALTAVPLQASSASNSAAASTAFVQREMAVLSFGGIVQVGNVTASAAVSNSTYYWPSTTRNIAQSTAYTNGMVKVPVNCTIVAAAFRVRNSTAALPSADLAFSVRTNNLNDVSIGNLPALSVGDYTEIVTNLNIPLNAGDHFAVKFSTQGHTNTHSGAGFIDLYLRPR